MADLSSSSSSSSSSPRAAEKKALAVREKKILAAAAQQLMQLSDDEEINSSNNNNKELGQEMTGEVITSRRIKISIEEIFGKEDDEEDDDVKEGDQAEVIYCKPGKRRYRAVSDLYSVTKPLNNDRRYLKKKLMLMSF